LALPYDVALAYVFVVCGIGSCTGIMRVPMVPGLDHPGDPVVLLFLGDF